MIVLDAAALVDVVIDQPTKGWVLERLQGEELIAPAHQPAEVVSALGRLVRGSEITSDQAIEAVDEAMALHQEHLPLTAAHLRRALELSDRVRVLDGLYVAVAENVGAPLLTTDRRLARASLPITIHHPPGASS